MPFGDFDEPSFEPLQDYNIHDFGVELHWNDFNLHDKYSQKESLDY
jgi:hypothetical protein